nr:unnamed protein product [Callosobruchus chinensis]
MKQSKTIEMSQRFSSSQLLCMLCLLDGIPQERFLGFFHSEDRTAEAMCKIVCDIATSLECESKLVAQTYDGDPVMAGHLGGLQAKLKEKYEQAIFVHCLVHRLHLVPLQGMNNIKKSSKRTHARSKKIPKRCSHAMEL